MIDSAWSMKRWPAVFYSFQVPEPRSPSRLVPSLPNPSPMPLRAHCKAMPSESKHAAYLVTELPDRHVVRLLHPDARALLHASFFNYPRSAPESVAPRSAPCIMAPRYRPRRIFFCAQSGTSASHDFFYVHGQVPRRQDLWHRDMLPRCQDSWRRLQDLKMSLSLSEGKRKFYLKNGLNSKKLGRMDNFWHATLGQCRGLERGTATVPGPTAPLATKVSPCLGVFGFLN